MSSSGEGKYLKNTGLPGQTYGAATTSSKSKITPVMDPEEDLNSSLHTIGGSTGNVKLLHFTIY